MTGGSRFILPDASPEAIRPISWLIPHFADENGRLKMSIHALLVEVPGRRIIVDTCLGNDKQNRRIPDVERSPGDVSCRSRSGRVRARDDRHGTVHAPPHRSRRLEYHAGGTGEWVPTFPNARYLFGRVEFEHWSKQTELAHMLPVIADSVQPILDRGLAELVEWDHQICPEVRLTPSIGHSPGHASVLISSKGERAMITGYFAHHPCQMAHPEWASTADDDAKAGEATRRRIFGELAGEPVLVIGTHFAGPTAGRVVRDGDAFRLDV